MAVPTPISATAPTSARRGCSRPATARATMVTMGVKAFSIWMKATDRCR